MQSKHLSNPYSLHHIVEAEGACALHIYQLIVYYSVLEHILMTFLWNSVCYDHKVKVMKGEL